jgi:DNA-binding transcriptional regulator YbjK
MPPPNPQRRAQLSAAAMRVLAEEGSRGLTHRAVDAAAAVPPGTTSRYFRSREALLTAVVEHALGLHLVEIDQADSPATSMSQDQLVEMLAAAAGAGLGPDRIRHIAVAELYLESSRRPSLRATMAEATRRQLGAITAMFAAAGLHLTESEVTRFVAFVDGLLFMLLTAPPDGAGPPAAERAAALVRDEMAAIIARHRDPYG